MTSYSDIPNDFKASVFPDYVRIVTGNAIICSQYVERVFNALCLILKTKNLRFTLEDFMSGDSARTRQTLGMIEKEISNTKLFDPSFSDRLTKFVRKRNRVVHGLFADTFGSKSDIHFKSKKAQTYVKECEWVMNEGDKLIDVVFGIYRTLGNIILKSEPDNTKLVDLIHHFDDYEEEGLEAFLPQFRPHLKGKIRGRSSV